MTADSATTQPEGARQTWLRVAALALVMAAVGIPVNSLWGYGLAAFAAVLVFSGPVVRRGASWLAAVIAVAVSLVLGALLTPAKIEEGHNLFLPAPALQAGLPGDVYEFLRTAFEKRYPAARHCAPQSDGCWRAAGLPQKAYAFSADGIFSAPEMSRRVSRLDFSDPVWLRLGFVNDAGTNWYGQTDVERAVRDRRFWKGFDRWRLTMPWFEAIRIPAGYADGELCWRGDLLWEGEGGRFTVTSNASEACRAITPSDIGRRVFGAGIEPQSLTMRLVPPVILKLRALAVPILAVIAVAFVLAALVRVNWRRLAVPSILIGASLLVIAIDDASFIGGMRPFDGGDDGLFYDFVGRDIMRYALSGDWWNALRGGESVFYYGGPGMRYFRALEHVVFGESYLGYLTLVLVLPFAVWAVFRRFAHPIWALAAALAFVAIPVGALFGTTFVNYAQWAGRGFADPAAYIFYICGIVPIVGASVTGPSPRFGPAFFGGLLMALAIFMKPIVAPACAVLLAGAGLAALYHRQWHRLVGLCLGFAPVFLITLHNYVYGGVFVLFSANSSHPLVLTMPPSAYLGAVQELFAFSGGENIRRGIAQLGGWLSGPSESRWLIPVSAFGVAIAIYVAASRRYDPWLRLLAGAALAQHIVALFYVATARYHFLAWFLTLVPVTVWLEAQAWPWLRRRYPQTDRIEKGPLASALQALHTMHSGKATSG